MKMMECFANVAKGEQFLELIKFINFLEHLRRLPRR